MVDDVLKLNATAASVEWWIGRKLVWSSHAMQRGAERGIPVVDYFDSVRAVYEDGDLWNVCGVIGGRRAKIVAAIRWAGGSELVGGFMAINIADILCFRDPTMPRIASENVSRRRQPVTAEQVLDAMTRSPDATRRDIARELGCSEQTVDRRLHGIGIRGGKYETQTRVHVVGGMLERFAREAGLFLYDRRIWHKGPAWKNSRWHTVSYRSVDEFEYVYVFWKPGPTVVRRDRLAPEEWTAWGSRGVWSIPSVAANDDHEAKFPIEIPRRVIRLLTDPGDLVLDCFVGSGTSGQAALQEGRRFIGIDKSPACVELAGRRMA